MSWFFGRRSDDDDGDDDEEEYTSDEYTSDEDDEGPPEEVEVEDSTDEEEEYSDDDDDHDDGHEEDHNKDKVTSSTKADAPLMEATSNGEQPQNETSGGRKDVDEDPSKVINTGENGTQKVVENGKKQSQTDPVINDQPAVTTKAEKEEQVPSPTKEEETNRTAEEEKEEPASASQTNPEADENKQEEEAEEEEEEEEVTSTHEKRSLLVLAAEHDRVDIMKAILSDDKSLSLEDKEELLNQNIPPLHIAIAYGSTNAVQCLLRMGADPSVRPNIQQIKENQWNNNNVKGEQQQQPQLVDIPNMNRFNQLSAWELAFGGGPTVPPPSNNNEEEKGPKLKKKNSWFGGTTSSDNAHKPLDIAPSKLEGIRHAFTAEALRCIGSDEVERLVQLRESGMPSTIDIGGKTLYEWAVEMDAVQCEQVLRASIEEGDEKNGTADATENMNDSNQNVQQQQQQQQHGGEGVSAVLDRSRPGTETVSQLSNRIDELESLAKALSTCLDNLAEEVSVCHGLLLMGGGASALASHVRSLKTLKENKLAELDRLEEAWENSEDELTYWVKQCGEKGREIAELMSPAALIPSEKQNNHTIASSSSSESTTTSPEEQQAQKHQLKAQAAILENKVRKLRASITDLSEENTRDLEEVEKRGLSGGIKLVRTLRDELREVEFTLNETRSAESLCRAKIKLIQAKMGVNKQRSNDDDSAAATPVGNGNTDPVNTEGTLRPREENSQPSVDVRGKEAQPQSQPQSPETKSETAAHAGPDPALQRSIESSSNTEPTPPSQAIATGQSTAIALKNKGTSGYFTVDLWKILLRIIGLRSSESPRSSAAANSSSAGSTASSSNVMIV